MQWGKHSVHLSALHADNDLDFKTSSTAASGEKESFLSKETIQSTPETMKKSV